MIDTIIFDLDGTLADTEGIHFKAWRQVLLDNKLRDMSFDDFLYYVGTSNEKVAGDSIKQAGSNLTIENLVLEKQQLYLQLLNEVQLCSGARWIVQLLGQMEIKIAVASSSHEKEVRAILKNHNLEHYFQEIICGDMVTNKKPDPEIYLKTLQLLGSEAGQSVAFEDSEHGVVAAKAAGMIVVALPNRFTVNHTYTDADWVLKSFNEVGAVFSELGMQI